MILKGLVDEDFINYKKPSMFLIFPKCDFKCDKECKKSICQNSNLIKEPNIEISIENLIIRYINNPISQSLVCGGLEPFDSWTDLYNLCIDFRSCSKDTIVIYTGYKEEEIQHYIKLLSPIGNIIVKFGRFIPNSLHKFDTILGVELASDNQYAKFI